MRFQGKVALVTGGSQGIGEAVCRRLASEGASVAVVASSSQAKADAVAASLPGARGYVADVRDTAALRAMVAKVVADFGTVDILVNAAGVFLPTPAGAADEAVVDQMLGVNLKGTFMMVDAVTPTMKASGGGAIVNVASVAGVAGIGTYGIYCATKAGGARQHGDADERGDPDGRAVQADARRDGGEDAVRADLFHAGGDGGDGRVPGERRGSEHAWQHRPDGRRHLGRPVTGAISRGRA